MRCSNEKCSRPLPWSFAFPAGSCATAREREVTQLLAEGKSSKEVASLLNLNTKTVETHRSNIMRKLSLHSIRDLVVYAIKNNIIQIQMPPQPGSTTETTVA